MNNNNYSGENLADSSSAYRLSPAYYYTVLVIMRKMKN